MSSEALPAEVSGRFAVDEERLDEGWELAAAAPGAQADEIDGLGWAPARVPGTVAGALPSATDLDATDWWFRTTFAAARGTAAEEVRLCLDGLATLADVWLNGEHVLRSISMFAAHELDVGAGLQARNELLICCRALAPLLATPRRPRARWRTRLADNGLRWWRTMLLGRAPGVADGPPVVGPWRAVRLVRRRGVVADRVHLRPRVTGATATLGAEVTLRAIGQGALPDRLTLALDGPTGHHDLELVVHEGRAHGALVLPRVALWWPHTHGTPDLYEARLHVQGDRDGAQLWTGRVGFRSLAGGPGGAADLEHDGLALHVNDVPVFARGVVWTPLDPIGMAPGSDALRRALEQVRDAGMNLVRIPGTAAYEEPVFYDLCDELGLLVWQDLMFANFDYPADDPEFAALAGAEISAVTEALAGRPSFAVLCGNSEVEQQAAMLGLDPALGRGELFGEIAPRILAESGADAVYVPSAPCGGALPMRPDRGVANWFGVGGYRRGLDDARRADVRFASECLAFANLSDAAMTDRVGLDAGVPRDAGASWDFADVRDTYLEMLHGVDARALRREDAARYAELSRAVTGEAMAAVMGEWRRAASPCAGAIVLWLRDLRPGAGWGVVDADGRPKLALGHLRRALAPVAVWMTDEGLGGLRVHVANDYGIPLSARLEIALHRDGELCVERAEVELEVPAHGGEQVDAETVLGHFADINYTHRFGPPGHDVVVASLTDAAGALRSQAFAFPVGPPREAQPPDRVGLTARIAGHDGPDLVVELSSRRLAYGVRLHAEGHIASDDGFCIAPGGTRTVRLRPGAATDGVAHVTVSALNVRGRVAATENGTR